MGIGHVIYGIASDVSSFATKNVNYSTQNEETPLSNTLIRTLAMSQSKVGTSTLITRKREPAHSFFLENLAPNILLLRPTRLCVEGKKLSYMFIQLLHVYKAVMVYFLRMLYFIFGDTFTSIKGILCQKTVH